MQASGPGEKGWCLCSLPSPFPSTSQGAKGPLTPHGPWLVPMKGQGRGLLFSTMASTLSCPQAWGRPRETHLLLLNPIWDLSSNMLPCSALVHVMNSTLGQALPS